MEERGQAQDQAEADILAQTRSSHLPQFRSQMYDIVAGRLDVVSTARELILALTGLPGVVRGVSSRNLS